MRAAVQRFTNISLFSGAMGLDLGLERAGFATVLAVDVSPAACDTIRFNRPHVKLMHADIRSLTADAVLREAGMMRGEPDLISGGPACQAFTTIGKRRSIQDPRGGLVKDFVRIVADARPKFFVMENVRGILSAPVFRKSCGKKPKKVIGGLFTSLLADLKKSGYTCSWALLNSADYGIPQIRRRVFIVGNRLGLSFHFPRPTHSPAGPRKWRTLGDALRGLKDRSNLCARYTSREKRFFRRIPPGGDWRSLPPSLQPIAMGGAFGAEGGRTAFFRRLTFDKPCPTLLCDPGTKACSFCHPLDLRPLSVAEYARVQQFPDEWNFCGSMWKQYELIANAVPTGLAEAVGKAVYLALKSRLPVGVRAGNRLRPLQVPAIWRS